MATAGRLPARALVPVAPLGARPLQGLEQVATAGRRLARALVPRAPVGARPLQRLEVAARRRLAADIPALPLSDAEPAPGGTRQVLHGEFS